MITHTTAGREESEGIPLPSIPAKSGRINWYQNKATYKGVGITTTPPQLASATLTVLQALMQGKGVSVSAVVLNTPLVTDTDVAQWYTSDMTTSSTGNAGGPASLSVLPAGELSAVLG